MEISYLPAGSTSLTNKEIETSIQSLAFTFKAPLAVCDIETPLGLIADAVIGDTEMNLQKQSGSETQTLIQTLPLRDLSEICTHNSGMVNIARTETHYLVSFTVEVTNHGALSLDDNAKLLLALSNIPVNTSVTIDGIDSPLNTALFVKYESKFVNANVSKDFTIEAHYAIALPTENIKALELSYVNGRNVKMSKREIQQVLRDSQDLIFNSVNKTVIGYDKFAILSVEDVVSCRVTLDQSTNFYLLKNSI